jgi:hypothetical protein
MDALLARQYDLLSCLDSKHPSVITAKKGLTLGMSFETLAGYCFHLGQI